MVFKKIMKYCIYHDESTEDGYWHSFVYIPVDKKDVIIRYLLSVKNKINENIKDISFKQIKNRATKNAGKPKLMRFWLSYIVAGMQKQKKNKMPMAYYSLDKGVDTLID